MKKQCNECGESFAGRADKKFCSDMCRNAFHNRQYGYRNAVIRNINKILGRNRKILAQLVQSREDGLRHDDLSELGFDFRYFTQERSDTKGCWRFCYEFGYTIEADQRIRIIERENSGRNRILPMVAEGQEPYKGA